MKTIAVGGPDKGAIPRPTYSLTARLARAAKPIWEAQMQHPFVRALGDGTLPQETFEFYIRQDALFLDELTKTFAYATTRSHDQVEMEHFGELLLDTIRVERALHLTYGAQFGLTPQEMAATPMAPTNYAYTRHLLYISATGALPELITAILPCAWIYADVGRHFTTLGPPADTHPYRDWVATYAAPDFEEVGAWLRSMLERHAAGLQAPMLDRLEEIFITSSRYEYMFWDMAWRREEWPDYGYTTNQEQTA